MSHEAVGYGLGDRMIQSTFEHLHIWEETGTGSMGWDVGWTKATGIQELVTYT